MRKTILGQAFLLLLLIGIAYACMESDEFFSWEEKLPPEISEAQVWYESQVKDGELPWKSINGKETNAFIPDWTKAFSNEDADYKVTEVHLEGDEKFFLVSAECAEKYQATGDARYLAADIRLVIRTNKKTKEKDGYIMVVYPDLSYLEANMDHPLRDISCLERTPDFDGVIYYHNMDGEFVNAWRFLNGIAYELHPDRESNESDRPQLRSSYCETYCDVTYWYEPKYSNGDFLGYYPAGTTYSNCNTYCTDTNPGGGGPGGGSGGSGGNTGNNNTNSTPEARTDCPPQAATNSTTINNVLNNVDTDYEKVKEYIEQLRNYASISGSNEYGLAVDYLAGQYYVYNQNRNIPGSNPLYISSGTPDINNISYNNYTYLIAHTHPEVTNGYSGCPAPSPLDAIALATAYKGGATNITANVVFGYESSEYMIYVSDRNAFSAFCNNPANSEFFNNNIAMFSLGSVWDSDYLSAYGNLRKSFSEKDAESYALAYVLDKYNIGLKIYEKKEGNFKEQKTEKSGNTYSPKICQ